MKQALALFFALAVAGCGTGPAGSGWITLIDGDKGLENFNVVGDANWRAEGGAIVADKGKGGFLVTKNSYKDFEIYAEFWAATETNSGIFMRAADPAKIAAATSYEVNIFDLRPDPIYATAGIVDVARVPVPLVYKAGGKWNTFEIFASGPQMTVKFNGAVAVSTQHDKFKSGPFALQFANVSPTAPGGPIKWRKVMVRPL
jgi:hypothetical protein